MAQITIDTDRDSVESIKKIISLLEHTIAEKGGHVVTNVPSNYSNTPNYGESSMPSSAPVQPTNPFAMFDTPSTSQPTPSTTPASQPSQQGGDIFSVFADTPPSTSPGNYGSYDNYETSSTYSTSKSADELLNEIDSSDMMGAFDEYESEEKDDDEKDFFQLESY